LTLIQPSLRTAAVKTTAHAAAAAAAAAAELSINYFCYY
jgi:hypothetical protein